MKGTCLITGGGRGIGRETARRAAVLGWDVAIVFRDNVEAAEAAARDVREAGRKALIHRADVAREADIVSAFKAVDDAMPPLGALVNSAGISVHARVDSLDAAGLERMFAVNVTGLMLCCREAARRMSTRHGGRGGGIVNVSSMAATIGGRPSSSTYASSKGAVDVFTTGFAREVAAEGIRVNAVRPGITDTEMIGDVGAGAKRAAAEATIPMRRFATPGEIAEAIVWLLSDACPFLTGAHLNIGGGGFHIGAPS